MRKAYIVLMGILLLAPAICVAQTAAPAVDQELLEYYKEEGRKEARQMVENYFALEKPQFQEAYNDYLNDLKVIAETGRAPDNEALYNDLRLMNSEEIFVYSDSEEKYYQ